MNEWMNELFKKEHTRPPRTCRNEQPTPRVQHSARATLMLVHCQRTAWTRPLLPRDLDAEAGRQPVAVSPELCSCSRSHPQAETTGRTRDPHSTSGQQTRPPSLTSRRSRSSFTFTSSDLRRSFLAVSRSSSISVTWAERAARSSFIWLRSSFIWLSRNWLFMISWSWITRAREPSRVL